MPPGQIYRYRIGLWVLLATAISATAFWFCLPRPLFDVPYSRVLEGENGELLGVRIAEDGQWRFGPPDSLPPRFVQALLFFEDRRFFRHHGLDARSLGRALLQNARAGRIVSGASTLSMQLMRLARGNAPRTLWNKALECAMAARLELTYSKEEILQVYATQAPFGGNTVGLEAAAWRYFGKPPALLSWAEAATLAVLPNQPAMIHPGRNRKALRAKRNRLLRRLAAEGILDSLVLDLALAEPLPQAPTPFPNWAPHFLEYAFKEQAPPYRRLRSSLDTELHERLVELANRHAERLADNQIHNLAILVIHLPTQTVKAYVGNAARAGSRHEGDVDMVQAERSTGSILKPFLYAFELHEGQLLPASLLPDIPTVIGGFRPENFHLSYEGAVPAHRALQRSLNIPFVYLLKKYGLAKFHHRLRQLGLRSLHYPPEHYGLTLILGGAEATLWDLSWAYAGLGKTLLDYDASDSRYDPMTFRSGSVVSPAEGKPEERDWADEPPLLGAAACWHTLQAMRELERPMARSGWRRFTSSRQLAWKTGTSFGFRDAWAIGLNPEYAIGIWVGNADGEGRPGLVGIQAAAPLLFDVLQQLPLPSSPWFLPPYDDMRRTAYCRASGWRSLPICTQTDTSWLPTSSVHAKACPYHQVLHLDPGGQWQVRQNCPAGISMQDSLFFVLPPAMAHYFRQSHPDYAESPPLHPKCRTTVPRSPMQLIYPRHRARIYLPVDLDGQPSKTIFELAHEQDNSTVFWHLDDQYLGRTRHRHSFELAPSPGPHLLTLVDDAGHRLEQAFEVIARKGE